MTPRTLAALALVAAAPLALAADPAAEAAKSYRIETTGTTQQLTAGEKGTFVISIVPLEKVHVHPQAPLKIALEATPGLKLEKTTLGKADPVDPKADGRRFEVLKLRTMRRDAEGKGPVFATADDPRATPVGRVLRRLRLDELPQLVNVLRGEMSLVGPRPPLLYEVEEYKDWHKRRFEAIPGITGLWQVEGRNRVSFDEMVRMDLDYIEHRSIWLDIKLLIQTPLAVVSGKGAG